MKPLPKEDIEKLVIENFWKEVAAAERSNDRREDYISVLEPAGEVWYDFDFLPEDIKFEDLTVFLTEDY